MPPACYASQPRRVERERPTPFASLARLALASLALLAHPPLALAWEGAMDPVFVFYPQTLCAGEQLALEVWSRDEQRWVAHPSHPVIPLESCQLEDAGVLLNEIRWRCLEAGRVASDPGWRVGVRVFEPAVMQHCGVARTGSGFGEAEIRVSTPKPGETIADADGNAEIEGSVWIGGLAGAEYDIVIAIDTSRSAQAETREDAAAARGGEPHPDADPLDAQLRAARAFVDSIRDRLGAVRVGVVSFPNAEAASAPRAGAAGSKREPAARSARRELPLSDDAAAIRRALDRLARCDRSGEGDFAEALSLAIDELFRPPDWPGAARPGARRIAILSAVDRDGFPFGPNAETDREFRERVVERAREAAHRGVALHLFALGGISEEPPAFVDEMLANPASGFARVSVDGPEDFFSARVSTPYLEQLSIHDARTGRAIGQTTHSTDGRFAASVPLEPGENRLTLRARMSDGDEREAPLAIEFDASAYKDRLLAREAARIRSLQAKRVTLEVVD